MELPRPPDDPEAKNIIDKLAQFVARNGPEFEKMTKTKQEGNPKFAFLFGGENYAYYDFKVIENSFILLCDWSSTGTSGTANSKKHRRPTASRASQSTTLATTSRSWSMGASWKSGRTWWPWGASPWTRMGPTVETKQPWSRWTSNGRAKYGNRSRRTKQFQWRLWKWWWRLQGAEL